MTARRPSQRHYECGKCRLGIPHTDADHAAADQPDTELLDGDEDEA